MRIVRLDPVKRGRITLGHLVTLDSGEIVYAARRRHRHIFRSGRASISAAMEDGEAAWAIDETTLYMLRTKGVKRVAVRVEDTGDIYLTALASFFDLRKARVKDYSDRGGSRQRYLPLDHFTFQRGRVTLQENTALAGVC
jgi:hypothetical protein